MGGQRAAIGNQLLLNNVSVDCDVDGFQDLISAWGAKGMLHPDARFSLHSITPVVFCAKLILGASLNQKSV